jgi:hypothetical protein
MGMGMGEGGLIEKMAWKLSGNRKKAKWQRGSGRHSN